MTVPAASNFLLTGPSGIGKSSLLRSVVRRLGDLRCRGFLSESFEDSSGSAGWRLHGLNSEDGVLADPRIDSPHKMGRYGVDFDLFSRVVSEELRLDVPVDLFVIDEIGIISSWDSEIEGLIEQVLSSAVPVVTIVREKGDGLAARVRLWGDVRICHVNLDNRDQLVDEVVEWICSR